MSNFVVSARKYRPSTFASVVGQEALTTTLRNAILQDKLSHAYLFCGPRGVGKTSCARIFAKTINCLHRTDKGEACNECESCVAANEQRSYNIFELDAASNNSVNDIRQLTEQVYIPPSVGKYRVYIIDEVHMLSSSAFNAFLKTLEEPPAHAIFILATTEKNKVLPTIISRCQVHDFNRITPEDITRHLQYVAKEENIQADTEALQLIAISADGGMRDALSMFDQIAGFGNGVITIQGVRDNLNLLDEDEYFQLLAFILQGKHDQVLLLIDALLRRGYEGDNIMRGFSTFLRNVLLSQSPETASIVEAPDSIRQRLLKAGQYSKTQLLWEFLKISTAFGAQYKNSSEKRLALEVALLKMVEKCPTSSLYPTPQNEADGTSSTPKTVTSPTPSNSEQERTANEKREARKAPEAKVYRQSVSTTNTQAGTTPTTTSSTKHNISKAQQHFGFNLLTGKTTVEEQKLQKQEKVALSEARNSDFSNEDLHKAWNSYAAKMPKGQILVRHAMLSYQPHIVTGTVADLEVKVGNDTEARQLNDQLPGILKYLADSLQNDNIRIQIEIDNTIQDNELKTPEAKFEHFEKTNEWFAKFAEDLDLRPMS